MSDGGRHDAPVGENLGGLPILILLGALFVAAAWWVEPLRFRLMQTSVQLHPTIAERALHDDSERIVMLGCNQFDASARADVAERILGARPRLQRLCVSDVYLGGGE
jgi:hypothetical protein